MGARLAVDVEKEDFGELARRISRELDRFAIQIVGFHRWKRHRRILFGLDTGEIKSRIIETSGMWWSSRKYSQF